MCQPGKPTPQGLLPFELPARAGAGRELPEREVSKVSFAVLMRTDAAMLGAGSQTRQFAVVRRATGIEVHAVARAVREATRFELFDHRDLFGDMRAGLGPHVRPEHRKALEIRLKKPSISLGDGQRRTVGSAGRELYLVRAFVCIRSQVADVGDVDHVFDGVAGRAQCAPEQICEHIGTHVAQMLPRVHGRPTAVDADRANRSVARRLASNVTRNRTV